MDLSFDLEYEKFRSQVRHFVEKNREKQPKFRGPAEEENITWQRILIDNGYAARTIPKKYGGYGAKPDIIKSRIISEEFSRLQMNTGLTGQGIKMLVPILLQMGTEEQRLKFIRPTIQGELNWCQGYSEPGAGSDLASLNTRAELDGEDWVINGQKIWTSSAHTADWIFCLVRTEAQAPKHQGISFLLFKMDSPGIEIRPLIDMTMKPNFNEVFFTNVRVPKQQIVGQRGEGWSVANALLGFERGSLAPSAAALSRLNELIKLMHEETVNGEPLISKPQFRERLMKIQGRTMAMSYNDMRLISAQINKNQDTKLASMIVKLQSTELRHELEGLAIDVMGEIGLSFDDNPYLRGEGGWQYQYMYFLGLIIGGGTNQIQRNIISERGLGMPKEPKSQEK